MSSHLIARIAWVVPALLLALSIHQVSTAVNLARTLDNGEQAIAEVTRYDRSDRKDVTHVELDLRVRLSDGTLFERTRLALPYSIGHRVEADSLAVTVLPGSSQEVVITVIGRTQVSIAWSNAAMSFVIFLMAFAGVFSWDRWLRKNS
ncbi:MAG: hypothetical protein ACPG3U_05660 [Rhodothermales bacterium]|jgi:hypothetical protein